MESGGCLKRASCRGGSGELSCTSSYTVINSVAVARTSNLSIERRTIYHRDTYISCSGKNFLKRCGMELISWGFVKTVLLILYTKVNTPSPMLINVLHDTNLFYILTTN